MLEIRITAPELSEALNNLARALTARAETTRDGKTSGATHTNTTCAPAETSGVASVPAPIPTVQPVTGAPLNVAPASTATPIAPAIPAAAPAPTAPVVPIAAPQYDLETIAKAGTALIDAGRMDELTALLAKHGVEALTALDPSLYGTFASELRALGASI